MRGVAYPLWKSSHIKSMAYSASKTKPMYGVAGCCSKAATRSAGFLVCGALPCSVRTTPNKCQQGAEKTASGLCQRAPGNGEVPHVSAATTSN